MKWVPPIAFLAISVFIVPLAIGVNTALVMFLLFTTSEPPILPILFLVMADAVLIAILAKIATLLIKRVKEIMVSVE